MSRPAFAFVLSALLLVACGGGYVVIWYDGSLKDTIGVSNRLAD